jgi:SsrA-binding protein
MPPEIRNKKAYFNYEILEKFEAGIELQGTEVKSLRLGSARLKDAFARMKNGEVWLVHAHISQYGPASKFNHDPERPRKLLLHKREIGRLTSKIEEKGLTLLPLKLYFNSRGIAKVMLGLGRGKRKYDKRDKIRRRDVQRDMERELKRSKRR